MKWNNSIPFINIYSRATFFSLDSNVSQESKKRATSIRNNYSQFKLLNRFNYLFSRERIISHNKNYIKFRTFVTRILEWINNFIWRSRYLYKVSQTRVLINKNCILRLRKIERSIHGFPEGKSITRGVQRCRTV